MIAELGHYALVLALGLALVQSVVPIWGSRTGDAALMAVAGPVAVTQFIFVATAFAALTFCYVSSDFSVLGVYESEPAARTCEIAAQAKIGAHRLIKIRLVVPSGVSVLQLQWQQRAGIWHVVEAELVRVEPAA